eukprot:640588-Pleurochrysis_carterae.AAC.4
MTMNSFSNICRGLALATMCLQWKAVVECVLVREGSPLRRPPSIKKSNRGIYGCEKAASSERRKEEDEPGKCDCKRKRENGMYGWSLTVKLRFRASTGMTSALGSAADVQTVGTRERILPTWCRRGSRKQCACLAWPQTHRLDAPQASASEANETQVCGFSAVAYNDGLRAALRAPSRQTPPPSPNGVSSQMPTCEVQATTQSLTTAPTNAHGI